MRCNYSKCELNHEGYCLKPDYVVIGEDGTCDQMWVKKMTITNKYKQLRVAADEAYTIFDNNPTQANSDAYGMALNELRDFCIEVIDRMVEWHPEIANKIYWEED